MLTRGVGLTIFHTTTLLPPITLAPPRSSLIVLNANKTAFLGSRFINTAIDTSNDGILDSFAIDTVGDGKADSIRPIEPGEALNDGTIVPRNLQSASQSLLANPVIDVLSLVLTITLIFSDILGPNLGMDIAVEQVITIYFALEFTVRWVSAGLVPRYLLTPLMLIDFLNLLPVIAGFGNTPLAALRLLRLLRVLRLRRLLGRGEIDKLAQALTGNPNARVDEVERVLLGFALSVVSIVLVAAGAAYEAERLTNPTLSSYADALYFSITTLTTVGFGDVVPITPQGRAVVALEMLAAVTVVPFEASRIANALREKELESSSNDDSLSSLERFTDEQLLSEVKRRGL